MRVREPAVAGSFYPADPGELGRNVTALLRGAERTVDSVPPKALIVPHAGYVYSGPTAAAAYARLASLRDRIRRVVLIGPAHRVALAGIATLPVDAMRTPLGLVPVDHEAMAALHDLPGVAPSEPAHAWEHALEVQLPFLQTVLGSFSVVPLVVGDATDEQVAQVLERLWGGPETLVVVSSDLSHYHDDATARRLDAATCRAIEAGDPGALDWESACGRLPIRGLLRVVRRLGLSVETLDLRNSGDTAGSRREVVGYGAWAFRPGDSEAAQLAPADAAAGSCEVLSPAASRRLLEVARRSIRHGLRHGCALEVDPTDFEPALRARGAAFVTLKDETGALRGCIGSLEARRPLVEDVAINAWAAARDRRFAPLPEDELGRLSLHLSILAPPAPLAVASRTELVAALRPDRDGLILEDGVHRATFLPQVWESVRDADEFVALLWRKAGLPGDHWSSRVRALRYEIRPMEPSGIVV